jgi:hypothetical protein
VTTEVSVPECLAIRVLRSADVRLWCTNGELTRVLRPRFAPATDLLSVSEQTTGNTKVGLYPRFVGNPESAGINRHVVGDERAVQERNSESILASSLAGDIARWRLKRRQRYRWAGRLSFEKPMEQDADSIPSGGRQHDNHANREWLVWSCVV